jgi:hypothetical protein
MKNGGSALQCSASALTHTQKKRRKTIVSPKQPPNAGFGHLFQQQEEKNEERWKQTPRPLSKMVSTTNFVCFRSGLQLFSPPVNS